MKAASPILPQIQRPVTLLGLPPVLFGLAATAGSVAAVSCLMMGIAPLTLPVAVTALGGLWAFFWQRARADHHYDRLLINARRIWKGKVRTPRSLIAGRRP
ncbi:hypothetical protein [Rhodospirillum sp. A1_3_36]|uniref:hypothetical protein n=1 Tax=Rhodospirillum sp. A1_3_36 TaxID=3391666 RepID=UPI0039A4CE8C